MITTLKIIEGLGGVEDMLLRNIIRTLVELEMHSLMSAEQILQYYNVESEINETDRNKLIDDTLRNLKGDIFKLEFYQKNKSKFIHAYGKNYNKVGDIEGVAQRRADEGMRKRSAAYKSAEDTGERRGQDSQRDDGPSNDATKGNNAEGDNHKEQGVAQDIKKSA